MKIESFESKAVRIPRAHSPAVRGSDTMDFVTLKLRSDEGELPLQTLRRSSAGRAAAGAGSRVGSAREEPGEPTQVWPGSTGRASRGGGVHR